ALAVRGITTGRGLDPRDYTLVAYGGGGPPPPPAVARGRGISRVGVPPAPAALSPRGMLATHLRHDPGPAGLQAPPAPDATWAHARYAEMQQEVAAILPGEGTPLMHRAVDLRYVGQEHTVTIAASDLADWADLRKQFDDAHERAYGYAATDVDVQLLNLRLTIRFAIERPRLPRLPHRTGPRPAFEARKVYSLAAGDF